MNFHSLVPLKYKKFVVTGMVHRIFCAYSTGSNFHASLRKAKLLLTNNQYPESLYEPLIKQILTNKDTEESNYEDEKCLIFLRYRGKVTEQFIISLHILGAPRKHQGNSTRANTKEIQDHPTSTTGERGKTLEEPSGIQNYLFKLSGVLFRSN